MSKKRILIVTQEMNPYTALSNIGRITTELAPYMQSQGMEIRVLMPRFGIINERRHRLHEVVRLSGINIIIDNDDHPLIIKVASLPNARLQVYFLDNEDYFKRKLVFKDENEKFFDDNADRMVFFCKGVMETVKKFGWPPDIIHCHGWMTSLIPMYVKTVYRREPVFMNSKVIYSVYEKSFADKLSKRFLKKAILSQEIKDKDFEPFTEMDNLGLNKGGILHSDAIILGSQKLDTPTKNYLKNTKKKRTLDFVNGDEYLDSYEHFYQQLMTR